jgi:hypothetical protein
VSAAICRGCGCTQLSPCYLGEDETEQLVFCHWVETDLCSACADAEALELEPLGRPCANCGRELFDRASCDACGLLALGGVR